MFYRGRRALLACSLCALQNLVSVMPADRWRAPLATMLTLLLSFLERAPESADAVSGVLVALLHRTADAKDLVCILKYSYFKFLT